MKLRNYQQRSITDLYKWFNKYKKGNPCLVLPTGSGKSHVVAALCKDAVQHWPETRVLMLTHVKELIEQNAEKMRLHWPNAPMGVYSASIGRKQLDEPITFAGIQSIRNKAAEVGHIDLVIVDECHLINHKQQGGYRVFISSLMQINPQLRVIGLTATPFRLGHGYIHEGDDTLFNDLINPVTIEQLIYEGYLSKLKSKHTKTRLDVSGVHKRGGEFIQSELQAAVDDSDKNKSVVTESITLAANCKHWLFFCAGVEHAEHVAAELNDSGISAACLHGGIGKKDREQMIADFESGKYQALTNCDILTTGFDFPDIDFIALLRPTASPALYIQMVGRGMRIKSHVNHCLIADFAGNIELHGPITNVRPPQPKGKKAGESPVKVCEKCDEIVHLSVMKCPECGYEWPKNENGKRLTLHNVDIMGDDLPEMRVKSWIWRPHQSRNSGKIMLKVTYYGLNLSDPPITEYFPVTHDGFAGQKARLAVATLAASSGAMLNLGHFDIAQTCESLNNGCPPSIIKYQKDGKFHRVTKREFNDLEKPAVSA